MLQIPDIPTCPEARGSAAGLAFSFLVFIVGTFGGFFKCGLMELLKCLCVSKQEKDDIETLSETVTRSPDTLPGLPSQIGMKP